VDQTLFRRFREIAYESAGIALSAEKEALVSARVGKRMRALGITTTSGYLERLEADRGGEELLAFLDAISTNYTRFFREPEHFEFLVGVVRQSAKRGRKSFRIWCAASSTGEEPYSLAICLSEALEGVTDDYRILATDISTRVLANAGNGVFSEKSLAPLSKSRRAKYFRKTTAGSGREPCFEVTPELKQHVLFRRLNLAKPPFPLRGPVDLVFCRNVMIYFDNAVRQGLISEVERLLRPGGYLVIGLAESLSGVSCELSQLRPSVYRKRSIPGIASATIARST